MFLLGLLTACGQASDPRLDSPPEPADINDSVIGAPLNQALERAADVENVIEDAAEQRRRMIEEAEGL